MYELMALQRDILYVIAGLDRPNGRRIRDELAEYYTDEVNSGYFYVTLDRMVRQGLVEKGPATGRTNYYEITEKGMNELRKRRRWEDDQLEDARVAPDA